MWFLGLRGLFVTNHSIVFLPVIRTIVQIAVPENHDPRHVLDLEYDLQISLITLLVKACTVNVYMCRYLKII